MRKGDLQLALGLAENHLEKGEWARVDCYPSDEYNPPILVYVGTVHTNGYRECHHSCYTVKNGGAVKHTGI
jgi:hypothetical protein